MNQLDPGESSSRKYHQDKAVDLARRILASEVGLIAGSREMSAIAGGVVPDTRIDRDFMAFIALASETDDLPLENERALWDPTAFAERFAKVAEIEMEDQARIHAACRSIIDRFADV